MEILVPVIVAFVTGCFGLVGSIYVARSSSDKVIAKLELNQAVQDEKVASYQRVTNEKIDELRKQNEAQAEWGTRIVLLEDWKRRVESEKDDRR